MPKTTKKVAKKVVRKPAAKKATKKTTTKRVSRKPKAEQPTIDRPAPPAEDNVKSDGAAGVSFEQFINNAIEDAMGVAGQFSASGMLNMDVRDRVAAARGEVVSSVRNLIDSCLALEKSAASSASERDVATAAQRLAVAEFELAMDGLEQTIRASR